ncbi:hypothetical protein L596_013439 [Steinernema carpocapsae]|uniref:Uncharacterized protein n=1 Tax=Steinernema carpocapsae TaxID=34508 RepID=A0A4U5P110_STECR|nr:hypothetical protein L596_013439 [Steinernema carpocapsae]
MRYGRKNQGRQADFKIKHHRELRAVVIYATLPNIDLILDMLGIILFYIPTEILVESESLMKTIYLIGTMSNYERYVRLQNLKFCCEIEAL